ncbi:hypothetical protein [Conexibacter woesei]|uniref:TfoX N-terminal domain-containing protein n=1 Tax=Conexibacter woesei (strain DSM 14684 / CCUG 47730 / CIP 108061 / JCM 11494 / NBRC 100937 / ID131577) TaxID=469383 RepID=D3FB24_CONWI|nr:hypothetical protein [Conexibacter woesei]ADB53216.1 hypothetical protein Cwoe_4803 [Conexibacter woesei DSM 14684]
MTTPEQSFAEVEEALLREPGTARGTGFGTNPGVTVDGKIAAMLVSGRLVVKLPADRCRELIDAGAAEPLQIGRRTMREWVTVDHSGRPEWLPLAREALQFVRPA